MSKPDNLLAGLLQGAIEAGDQETAHVAVSMVSVACGYLIPHAAQVETHEGVVVMLFHSPWRTLRKRVLKPKEQRKAMLRVQRALDRFLELFPNADLPPIDLDNCLPCVQGGICVDMLEASDKRLAIKRVQDAIDKQGWVVGSLDLLPDRTEPMVVVVHGYLIDKQTAKTVTDEAFAAFAQVFTAEDVPPDQWLLVERCEKCHHDKNIKSDFCAPAGDPPQPPQQSSGDSQSFAV